MYTINYKGVYIHGYCDRPWVYINTVFNPPFKSLHAAKCWVTRVMIPEHNQAMLAFTNKIKG